MRCSKAAILSAWVISGLPSCPFAKYPKWRVTHPSNETSPLGWCLTFRQWNRGVPITRISTIRIRSLGCFILQVSQCDYLTNELFQFIATIEPVKAFDVSVFDAIGLCRLV